MLEGTEQMRAREPINIDGPIPGESLTAEYGGRPWQKPPQYSTVDEAMQFYMQRMENDKFKDDLLDVIDNGIPLTIIANALQLGSVMEGYHSVDVGILVLPALVESLALIAENNGVTYKTGTEEQDEGMTETQFALAEKDMLREYEEGNTDTSEFDAFANEGAEEEEVEEEPVGLMSRRI